MFTSWFSEYCRWQLPKSRVIQSWLLYRSSMTLRIQRLLGRELQVKVICQSWQVPLPDEQRLLGLPKGQFCLVREVELSVANKILMYARSVLPKGKLTELYRIQPTLIKQPIGPWFFKQPGFQRSFFKFQLIQKKNYLSQKFPHLLEQPTEKRWARRSIFSTSQQELLLTEIFMPELFI